MNGKKEKENDTAWNYYFTAGGIFVLRTGASGKVINDVIEQKEEESKLCYRLY